MQKYDIVNYYHPHNYFQKLCKKYEKFIDDDDQVNAEPVHDKLAKAIGIVYTTKTKKVGKIDVEIPVTEFVETDFVMHLQQSFTVICVGENVAFYNYAAHHYEIVRESVYLSFFKQILDYVDASVWEPKREKNIAIRFIRDIQTRFTSWEIPEGKVVFNNGVLDVLSMEFETGDHPEIYNFHCTGYDFPMDSETYHCPEFMKYIWSVFEDQKLIDLVQEQYGYTFAYGIYFAENFFVWEGGGRNGKSIGQYILRLLHGTENCGAASLAQINSRFGASMVYNKILNICSENDDVIVESGLLKSITGRDRVLIDQKYDQPFEARVAAKILISTNSIFFNDRSRGFAERLIALPFAFTFTDNPRPNTNERQKQVDIMKKLESEIPQIALWALEGLRRLTDNNWCFTKSPKAEALKQKILRDSNPVLQFFEECCTVSLGQRVKMSEAYLLFKTFATDRGISVGSIVSANKFHQSFGSLLEERGLTSETKRVKGNNYYLDLLITI